MIYTVSDFLRSYEGGVRLLAGEGGLSRSISQVGILDYELMPGLKSRYQRVNFEPDQLVLSTFLYARDDPWLIGEAVKYLVGKGTSGLVVKNVLRLEIPESALRYANARDFPLLATTSDDFFFDVAIAEVSHRVAELADASFAQNELDLMLQAGGDPRRVRAHALRLNPSFREEHLALFVAESLSKMGFSEALACYHASELAGLGNLLVAYDGGLLYMASASTDVARGRREVDRLAQALRTDILDDGTRAAIGASRVHFSLAEMDRAVLEAKRSAALARHRGGGTVAYGDLGVLRALLPFAEEPEMRDFAISVLEPLRDFDAETNSSLSQTLEVFCEQGASVDAAAAVLGQHSNTVRYRLDKVAQITGLSYKVHPQAEQLSIACKIKLCQDLLRDA